MALHCCSDQRPLSRGRGGSVHRHFSRQSSASFVDRSVSSRRWSASLVSGLLGQSSATRFHGGLSRGGSVARGPCQALWRSRGRWCSILRRSDRSCYYERQGIRSGFCGSFGPPLERHCKLHPEFSSSWGSSSRGCHLQSHVRRSGWATL